MLIAGVQNIYSAIPNLSTLIHLYVPIFIIYPNSKGCWLTLLTVESLDFKSEHSTIQDTDLGSSTENHGIKPTWLPKHSKQPPCASDSGNVYLRGSSFKFNLLSSTIYFMAFYQ